jgi:hypothetical protein
VHNYPGVTDPQINEFALKGSWKVDHQGATPQAPDAAIQGAFQAQRVYLVLTSVGNRPRTVTVRLDGRPIRAVDAGADVHSATVTVTQQRLYALIALPNAGDHAFEIDIPPGVTAYDFTFG